MADESVDICERCGELRPGKRKLMFYNITQQFPNRPVAREHFCFRCLKTMRLYAGLGFSLLAIVVCAIVGLSMWLIL